MSLSDTGERKTDAICAQQAASRHALRFVDSAERRCAATPHVRDRVNERRVLNRAFNDSRRKRRQKQDRGHWSDELTRMDEFLAQRAIGRVFICRIAIPAFERCSDRGLAENQLAMNARDLAFICQMNVRLGEVSLDCKCQQCDKHQKARGGKTRPLAYADPGIDSSHRAHNTPMHRNCKAKIA